MEESASGEKAARALNLPIFSWLRPAVGRGDPKRRVRRRYKVADQVCSAGALYIGKAPLQQLNCNGAFLVFSRLWTYRRQFVASVAVEIQIGLLHPPCPAQASIACTEIYLCPA